MSIADNLGKVSERIQKATQQARRTPGSVRLLAVSKTRSAEELRQANAAGQFAFGENYLQEALDKIAALADIAGLEWHFIGPIQSNKTRAIAENFQWVHSVDRLRVAQRLNDQRPADLPPLSVCIQVNVDSEPTKSGVAPEAVEDLAAAILEMPRLRLRGLMAIPDPTLAPADLRQRFAGLATQLGRLRERRPQTNAECLDTLSIGMSNDLEEAIAEGATLVRVGTALFGSRH